MNYVVDTCVFNWLLDGKISPGDLPDDGAYVATHVQHDELTATRQGSRQAALLTTFGSVVDETVLTESAVADVSRVGGCKVSDGTHFQSLKNALDSRNNSKRNNSKDALIAEVAIVNGWTLITADGDLADVAMEHGCGVRLLQA